MPFVNERIATKTAEVNRLPRPWLAQVAEFGEDLRNDLAAVVDDQASLNTTKATARSRLDWVNLGVTGVTIGVGICLLLGFFTRLAALVGGLFLLSVMASQPPWVAGANTEYFFYQLVEVTALGVLFATGAGRWLGLDFFSYAVWNYFRGNDF